MTRKGILLAGGTGSRLFPLTHAVNKHLLPVYDKPMVYYPLTTLMLAGITEILVISSPRDIGPIRDLLGDGGQWGISISYAEQERPGGIPQAFTLGAEFIGDDPVALILGDNIFFGDELPSLLRRMAARSTGATVFGYKVRDPERYGIVVLDRQGRPVEVVEKPKAPKSNLAIPGLYFFDARAVAFSRDLVPSGRGEMEITDVIRAYLTAGDLHCEIIGRGWAWLDGGTHDSLLEAANFVRVMESRTGLKIACPEEVAFRLGLIDLGRLEAAAASMANNEYGRYLSELVAAERGEAFA